MKVIAINGSPRINGNTHDVLRCMADELLVLGIETEIVQIGNHDIRGCTDCGFCRRAEDHLCIFSHDLVNEISIKMRKADGFILGSPVYYSGIAGNMKAFLDRIFYSSSGYFSYKVATSVAVARRAGTVDVVHQLNNYLHLAETVLPPSHYWTGVYGRESGEALQDIEGIQTIRQHARSMGWLLNALEAGRMSFPPPHPEHRVRMNFIR